VWETREAKGRGALEEEGQLHRRDGDRGKGPHGRNQRTEHWLFGDIYYSNSGQECVMRPAITESIATYLSRE
jgi:hypothetical protein